MLKTACLQKMLATIITVTNMLLVLYMFVIEHLSVDFLSADFIWPIRRVRKVSSRIRISLDISLYPPPCPPPCLPGAVLCTEQVCNKYLFKRHLGGETSGTYPFNVGYGNKNGH